MAAAATLLNRLPSIFDERLLLMRDAELNRNKEYLAVVRIQSWYRGLRVRVYLRRLFECATNIQRHWRGFQTRSKVRQMLKERVYQMAFQHYTEMAIKIQKVWKGYRSRKYVFNFAQRKKYFEELSRKNEIIRNDIADISRKHAKEEKYKEELRKEQRLEEFARQRHYLVSTAVLPGVYNSPFQMVPNELEFRLRNVKLVQDSEKKTPGKTRSVPEARDQPLVKVKPIGPFKDPRDVKHQRDKPLEPTLRSMTNYFSLEEARSRFKSEDFYNRISDVNFIALSHVPDKPYIPQINNATKYTKIAYGAKHFREEMRDVWLTKNFKTVVPPIPVFDQLNKTY